MTQSNWPIKDIYWLGYFGAGTPEGVRYRNRSLATLALFVVASVLFAAFRIRAGIPIAGGLAFGYIAWEWWRYLSQLDELGRRLQMEAAAFTYGVAGPVAMFVGGCQIGYGWNVPATLFVLLELVRAWRLAVLARRYE